MSNQQPPVVFEQGRAQVPDFYGATMPHDAGAQAYGDIAPAAGSPAGMDEALSHTRPYEASDHARLAAGGDVGGVAVASTASAAEAWDIMENAEPISEQERLAQGFGTLKPGYTLPVERTDGPTEMWTIEKIVRDGGGYKVIARGLRGEARKSIAIEDALAAKQEDNAYWAATPANPPAAAPTPSRPEAVAAKSANQAPRDVDLAGLSPEALGGYAGVYGAGVGSLVGSTLPVPREDGPALWSVEKVVKPGSGALLAVFVSPDGRERKTLPVTAALQLKDVYAAQGMGALYPKKQ